MRILENTRIYLGQINWPASVGDGSAELKVEDYERFNQSLSPNRIRLPRDYKNRVLGNTNMFNGGEFAASLVIDGVRDFIAKTERMQIVNPHSLCFLLDFDESERILTVLPNLILFHKGLH